MVCCSRYTGAPDEQPVVRDRFNCRSNERNLSECPTSVGFSECGHNDDAHVICS